MANKWLQHLAQFRRQNRNIAADEVMKKARASYRGGDGKKGMPPVSPYIKTMEKPMGHVKAAMDAIKMNGGGNAYTPYEPASTDSTPSKVGGRRSRRQSRKRSRRTRRR